jgi:(2Fe-2S) ferredoxin
MLRSRRAGNAPETIQAEAGGTRPDGPNVVVYPDAVWYGHVTEADVEEIIESHILGGKLVERLRLADSCLNTATCEHRKSRT